MSDRHRSKRMYPSGNTKRSNAKEKRKKLNDVINKTIPMTNWISTSSSTNAADAVISSFQTNFEDKKEHSKSLQTNGSTKFFL